MAEFQLGVSVRLKGVKVNDDVLLERGSPVYAAAERAGRAAVKHVQDELIRKDAIDSGELYNSIDYEVYRSGKGIAITVGPLKGSDEVKRYANYVEYGTRGPITAEDNGLMPVKIKNGPLLFLNKVKGQEPKRYLRDGLKKVNEGDWY